MRSENWDKLTALIVLIVRYNKGLTNSRSIPVSHVLQA